ncbi:MAG: proline--tRNA ligase [Phycisphaerae bacterium]|nr:proline--tRNA ligase [Phycisphaerae bacterium]
MRYSQTFIPTVKEVPADAECLSHRLMVRAGLIRKVASGTYCYLPLGWRSLLKIIAIVREEMNSAGAQEIIVPSMQPKELWDKTGRSTDYGPTMFTLEDRHGRMNVLGPTAEEVFTTLVAGEIKSYKQLPVNLYQITPKFRDEFRPRFGPVRSREFIMKDAYSFDETPESLHKSYMAMYDAYCRIFTRCGVEYVIVEAESGEMGGSGSHQFTVPCESGEDTIVYTEDASYAANLEKAAIDPLAKETADADSPAPEEVHTPNIGTIEAVCGFLKTKPRDMIKTLIYAAGEDAIAVLVRGDHDLNPEKLTQTLGGAHTDLADEQTIEKTTGAKVGFAGPIGIAENVSKLIIDHAVAAMVVGVTGANKTDYHVKNVVPGRDFPLEGENVIVADLRYAEEGDTYEDKKLLFKKGIEVGQVFKLGTKYSVKLGAKFLDEQGVENPCLMGCYGIGINRILASAVELGNDGNGIIWPISIAPFEVLITCVNQDDDKVARVAETLYQQLLDAGVEVLYDDRSLRGGVKFKDADLIGIPIRLTIGKRSVGEGNIEVKLRRDSDGEKVPIEQAADKAVGLVGSLKQELLNQDKKRRYP